MACIVFIVDTFETVRPGRYKTFEGGEEKMEGGGHLFSRGLLLAGNVINPVCDYK